MRHVTQISFGQTSIEIVFFSEADVRNEGKVAVSRCVSIDRVPDYFDEIEDVQDAARRLLADALEDWENSKPVEKSVPPESEEEDSDDD